MAEQAVIRIKPQHYIHVLDNNTNVTRVETGPQTFTRQDHEKIVFGPEPMIIVPPRNYCIIADPIAKDEKKQPVYGPNRQVKLRYGDEEVRLEQEPFALFPGERLIGKVAPLQVVAPNTALRLKAIRDYASEDGSKYRSGDEWLFPGPATYIPRVEVQIVEVKKAEIIKDNQALRLRARRDTLDYNKAKRRTGEEWLVTRTGAYMPTVDEEVVKIVNAIVLTEKKGIHLRATRTFVDSFKKERKAGEEWIVTISQAETHLPDVYEEVVTDSLPLINLNSRQYAVILDPWQAGKQYLGKRELRKGELSFFLQPGERLEAGIQAVYVLSEDEALLLKAREKFLDGKVERNAGDTWMVNGPIDYIPPVEVEIVEKRKSIPLDENEGIYVRDIKTGKVRAVTGESYMLKPREELWKKEIPKVVDEILAKQRSDEASSDRDKTRIVSYRAPHNSVVQVYNYKEKKSRIVFGPDLVMLGPDEEFTLITLSGEVPKKEGAIKALCILLGPDFMADLVIVETADHARLSLKLAYNWHFEVDRNNEKEAGKVFTISDFVGDACKAIASRVRGAVAGVSFDAFHKNSADIIREACFGNGNNRLHFSSNNLVITNVDIQSVEPVDQKTRDSLQKSVQLAIEITTKSQEATARHESTRLEQEAMGRLERQKIADEANAERERKRLLQLQAESAAVESTGQATAEARARAESKNIEGQAAVKQAQLTAEALTIRSQAELQQLTLKQNAEIIHKKQLNDLEVDKVKEMSLIEAKKFKDIVSALGATTIKAMAEAGPAAQAKLLQGLGLKSFLITDGNSPINLFNTANGLLGSAQGPQ